MMSFQNSHYIIPYISCQQVGIICTSFLRVLSGSSIPLFSQQITLYTDTVRRIYNYVDKTVSEKVKLFLINYL